MLHQLVVGPHYAALVGIKERSSLIIAGKGAHGREQDVVYDVYEHIEVACDA